MSKCVCGYECRLPGEQEMLDQYGCAKTIVRREGPFNSLSVTMCSHDNVPPEPRAPEDTQAFADQFLAKYRKDGNNKQG
jgi:hypothetical protein